jgi:hypothetical protein
MSVPTRAPNRDRLFATRALDEELPVATADVRL